jgi:hypothetical protein
LLGLGSTLRSRTFTVRSRPPLITTSSSPIPVPAQRKSSDQVTVNGYAVLPATGAVGDGPQ